MKEARFSDRLDRGRVQCRLCPHDCVIPDGGRGACAVRYNADGVLYTLVADHVISGHLDPIEKKPLFHFYPGSAIYSIATLGCNMRCQFCQNWEISQWPREQLPKRLTAAMHEGAGDRICLRLADLELEIPGETMDPPALVQAALKSGASSIAYTYTEPTIFYELAYQTACLAKEAGMANVFVTNGFTSEAPQREIAAVLDAANVDLKFFRASSYSRISRARLQPVLDAIERYHALGVWLEVTTLIIPGVNDSDEELGDMAEFLSGISADIPWHVSRFHGAYEMNEIQSTPVATLHRAVAIGRAAGLRYVYEGNVPGVDGESTHCYRCGELLIRRHGFRLYSNAIRDGACPKCGARVSGVGLG